MTKYEFLKVLREALATELPQNEIDSNLMFYRDYIERESAHKSEDSVIEELGDPRLIAHTIIDTYKMNANVGYGSYQRYQRSSNTYQGEDYSDSSSGYKEAYHQGTGSQEDMRYRQYQPLHITKLKWYHKALMIGVGISLVALVLLIGGAIFSFLLSFGVPILIIVLIITLIQKR